ncbi:aspartic proteinase nepenthesin-1-like [Prunus yedoensis var. nudiflora]|uniref:Aspartic proteinase nepenthesin-1-like n=1 Tax=Prunus yedoensis var. nudiflora TaxID=2094558 RepID=A0A314Z460_PRUYE|nr:aspartic proteinase nepenthesin-1-like [Prunus yedoensis var. nudiflora]
MGSRERMPNMFSGVIPNVDGKQSTTCGAMLANNPLCVLPATGLVPISWSMLMALPLTEGLFGLEKFTFLSEQGQQAIPNVPYGLGLDSHVNFNDRYHGQPNPISGSMGLGRSHPPTNILQLNQITLQRFSYCLPPQFESQPSLLHFGRSNVYHTNFGRSK